MEEPSLMACNSLRHKGVDYLDFLEAIANFLVPSSYLEIGTQNGASLARFECDALCIDPTFQLSGSPTGSRKRTFFFQMCSDAFFAEYDLNQFFPRGIDIAFLDGMHQCESLLNDFINTEHYCHHRSLILLHDCLPVNLRMAERSERVDDAEDPSTRFWWTGDVWRLVPILKKYRPDLRIHYLDCPPTGLVAVTNLNPASNTLLNHVYSILDEFSEIDLFSYGLNHLWSLYPTLNSREIIGESSLAMVFPAFSVARPPCPEALKPTPQDRMASVPNEQPITVLDVRPSGNIYAQAYAELSETTFYGLQQLGCSCKRITNARDASGMTIVVGAHNWTDDEISHLSSDTIIYNTEHMGWIEQFGTIYLTILKKYEVWDYRRDTAAALSDLLGKEVKLVPFGFVPQLSRIEKSGVEEIDVLFYGAPNPRRLKILDELSSRGLRVHYVSDVFGTDRDDLIARSKVILNVHFYLPGVFESLRVCYALANRKAVVTECNPGEILEDDLRPGLVAVPFEGLVEACEQLVRDTARRRAIEEKAFSVFAARDEVTILRDALLDRRNRH